MISRNTSVLFNNVSILIDSMCPRQNVSTLILLFICFTFCQQAQAQDLSDKLKRKLKASEIFQDPYNEDGVFIARLKKSNKCGMYQSFNGKKIDCLIPPLFDSINFFKFNGEITGVWNNGKVGLYTSPWINDTAKQTVPCIYDAYKVYKIEKKVWDGFGEYLAPFTYVAVKKDGLWAWVDWITGELKTDFLYDLNKEKMPFPKFNNGIVD